MATLKIMMIGGRRCGKTTILSKIKQHFNKVLHHEAEDEIKNDLLTLLTPIGEITRLNNAQDCINDLFTQAENPFEEFSIDENPSDNKTITTFQLDPLRGAGSLSLEFTDIPGEWCSFIPGHTDTNHLEDVKKLLTQSNVIIIAIDTPSLIEENGKYADYYNRINDIKELFRHAFVGDTFQEQESQKMILFVPMKCEKYIIKNDGNTNIDGQNTVCNKVIQHYSEMIHFFKEYPENITLAILPIVTIKEVEWTKFFSINKNTGESGNIYNNLGLPRNFIYGQPDVLYSKFCFKPDLYYPVAEGETESQSLYCEQPLIYTLVFLFKYYTRYGRNLSIFGILGRIPIIGIFFRALIGLFNLFTTNQAYEQEATRLGKRKMLRGNGFKILQNPLSI